MIVASIYQLASYRVPLDEFDIRCMVKSYLDKKRIKASVFKNNLPGTDWLRSFMQRHNLTKRIADNVKISRAEVNAETINSYFDNLEQELKDIPANKIFNYDETNITDDPGVKTVIVRRGYGRRVEQKQEHSRQSTSVMFCGNAAGDYLPPMVVYKAKNLYQGWTEGDPAGTIYDSTPSGWFDAETFER